MKNSINFDLVAVGSGSFQTNIINEVHMKIVRKDPDFVEFPEWFPISQIWNIRRNISLNASIRAAVVVSNYHLIEHTKKLNRSATAKVLEELSAEAPRGMVFPRYHVLLEPFNKKLGQLLQGGIVQRLVEFYYKIKVVNISKGPEMLTNEHLEIGFKIWLMFVVLLICDCLHLRNTLLTVLEDDEADFTVDLHLESLQIDVGFLFQAKHCTLTKNLLSLIGD